MQIKSPITWLYIAWLYRAQSYKKSKGILKKYINDFF